MPPPNVPPLAADTKSVGKVWSPVNVTPLDVIAPEALIVPTFAKSYTASEALVVLLAKVNHAFPALFNKRILFLK